ncbi:hypothetical protein ANCDUO_21139 [Ancylostoma duodenale]|uniref:Neurotransmitter-gated ion-channel ligand-binding domain-containing protein n=1 Tax=Ancylostoma duodenale TaxID=51022 RepID=A0A0C2BXT8_9BILA|nr:hypothetical protein ANCDUO_21139 [Ancylostoma duodenale]
MNLVLLIGLAVLCECSRKDASIRIMSFNEITEEAGLDFIIAELADNWNWVRCTISETWVPDVAILTNLKVHKFHKKLRDQWDTRDFKGSAAAMHSTFGTTCS